MADDLYNLQAAQDTSRWDLPQEAIDALNEVDPQVMPYEVAARNARAKQELLRQRAADQALIRQSQVQGQREQTQPITTPQPAPVQPKVETPPEEPGLLGAIKRGLKAPGREIDAVSLNAQAADALDNPIKLADLALQKKKLDEGASESQKGFRSGIKSDGSFYDYLASLFGSAKANPEGALESTIEFATNAVLTFVVPELVGAGIGALAGGVGAVAAGPAVVGGVQAVLSSGEMGMAMMLKQAQQDGIDLTNKSQVAEWVKTKGVKDVYGKAQAGGLTNGAVIALTLGLAKYAGSVSRGLLGESGQTVAKAQEVGPLTPGMVGEAEQRGNTLLNQARLAKGGEIAAGTVGFGAASALSSKAAGEEVDDNSVFANAMMYMVPSLFGIRPVVRGIKADTSLIPPPGQRGTTSPLKKPPGGGGDKTTAELDEAFTAGEEQKPKSNAAKAVAEVNGTPEEQAAIVTSINNLTPFERAELAATAIQTVRPENIEAAVLETTRERLRAIAKNRDIQVYEGATSGFNAGKDAITVPTEDAIVESAISPDHVMAHELGHALLQKRGMSFSGFPIAEARKQITNYDSLVDISKAFRPGVWNHETEAIKRHARKPNEVIADAIGAVLLNKIPYENIKPSLDSIGLTKRDLGLERHEKKTETKNANIATDKRTAETGAIDVTKPATTTTDIGTTTPDTVATAGEVRLAEDGTVQQGARGEVTAGPGGSADIVSDQKGILEGPARQPDSGRPTGDTSGGGAAVVAKQIVPSGDASGKAGTLKERLTEQRQKREQVQKEDRDKATHVLVGERGSTYYFDKNTNTTVRVTAGEMPVQFKRHPVRFVDAATTQKLLDFRRRLEDDELKAKATFEKGKIRIEALDNDYNIKYAEIFSARKKPAISLNPFEIAEGDNPHLGSTLKEVETVNQLKTRKSKLLAGREATEEANRKAQADVEEALRKERDGDVFNDLSNSGDPVTGRQLRTAYNNYVKGKLTDTDVVAAVERHLNKLDESRQTYKERVRGADYVRERLLNARRTGEMSGAQADLALWLLNKAPHFGNDLAFSIRSGGDATSRGTYDSLRRLVTIFTERAGDDTATHEILHHAEAFMPRAVQEGIRKEWLKTLSNKINETLKDLENAPHNPNGASWRDRPREASLYLRVMLKAAEAGDYDLTKVMWDRIKGPDGVTRKGLREFLDYEMVSPSEFWAVNGPKLLRARMNAETWVQKALVWLREFYQKVRSVFGLESDAPVLRGLDNLITGSGTLKSKSLIDRAIITKDAVDKQNADTAKRIDKEGAGDVLGRDAQDNIKYRAWDNHDGTFRVYEVTPAEPMGDPKLHVEVNEANLKDFITNKGLEFVNRTAEGFDAEPVPSKNLIVRWRAGSDGKSTAVFMAKPDENGVWRAQVGEDLTTRGSNREYFDYQTKRDALEAANRESPHDTKQAADADGEASQVRDLITGVGVSNVVVPGDPSWMMKSLMDAKASVRYLAGATDEFMKRIGAELPPGMRLGVEYMLKGTDLSRAWRETLSNEAEPLMGSVRKVVGKYDTYYKGEEGYQHLNRDISDLVAVERLPKLRAKYAPTLDPKYAAENVAKEQAAKQRLQNLEQQHPGITADLTALMKEWKPFSDKTIDIMYEHNRISKDARDRIKNAYQIYAPLISEKKGTRKLTATGTSAEGSNVFERMIEARGSALKNGIDNEAMRVLVKLIRTFDYRNENGSKIFKIDPIDRTHLKHDPVTGIIDVTTEMNPRKSVVYYEGGVPHRIEIDNSALEKALSKFSEADADTALRKAIGAAGFFTRMFGVLHTSASPPFALRNFVRDLATNAAQLDPRISYTEFRKAMFDPEVWGAAFRLGFREAYSLTGKDSIKGSKLADAADRDGALIDRRFQYGVDQLPTQHRVSLRPSAITHAKELFGPTDGKILNLLTGITHSLEAVNRIAVYKAAKESGIDGREAGVLSKNATTNFERRGEYMHNISPFYAFANAKMQGARTLGENLGFTQLRGRNAGGITQGLRGLAGGRIADSANVRTVRAAQMAIGLGLAAAYLNYKSSPKDKDGRTTYGKRSEYQLDEYLHIPGLDIDLPIPQELGTFYNMGSSMGDWLFGDRSGSASGAMTRFITSTIQNFSPGGTSMHDPIGPNGEGSDYAFRLAMPTQALAVYDIVTNRDTFGREINPQKGRKDIPPEMQGAAKASQPANMLTQGLHKVGVDTSPKYIDHFLLNMFKQQQPLYNAVTQGAVGALVSNTFKSFRQEVYPGTTKLDYDTISQQVEQDAAREAGSPLKKKQYTGLAREFANTDEQIKKLREAYNKAKTDEQRKAVDEKQNDLRMKALKKYYEQTGVVQP